jgi:hypothetical protein
MKIKLMYCAFVAVIALLFTAGISLAHEVTISNLAKLGNGPQIEPGTYRVEVLKNQESPEVIFYEGEDEVIRTQVKLVTEPTKARQTAVYYNNLDSGRIITQIHVEGWKERLMFEQPAQEPARSE